MKFRRDQRSNSLIFEERGFNRYIKRQHSNGNVSYFSSLVRKNTDNLPDPISYINNVPVLMIPTREWIESHNRICLKQIKEAKNRISKLIKELSEKLVEMTLKMSNLLQDSNQFLINRKSFKGKGLKENRILFFLIEFQHNLKINIESFQIQDFEYTLQYLTSMEKALDNFHDFNNFFLTINLKGYIESIPNHKKEILELTKKLNILENHIKIPKSPPLPTDFSEQLIYPTSTTYSIFKNLENNVNNKTISEIISEFSEMTDDFDELNILIEHAFDFGWKICEFPFFLNEFNNLQQFLNVKIRSFDIEYIPEEFLDIKVSNLQFIKWPYSSVIDKLISIYFEINPIKMSLIFYESLLETAKCVSIVTGEPTDIDFDTLFPLIFICVLGSGLLFDTKLLPFISSIASIQFENTYCQLGASYAEAILHHISSLNENNLI